MGADAIEMRPALLHSPRVRRMVEFLRSHDPFLRWADLAEGGSEELLARAVVSSLMLVWATARVLAPDGLFAGGSLQEIDRIAGTPGIGLAMRHVGWLEVDLLGVKFPNFREHNPAAGPPPAGGADGVEYSPEFLAFWDAYPRKVGKGDAWRTWKKLRPSARTLELILLAVGRQAKSEQWRRDRGQFVPHPATWLNQRRWEDEVDGPAKPDEQERISRIVEQAGRRREESARKSPEELARIRASLARAMGRTWRQEGEQL